MTKESGKTKLPAQAFIRHLDYVIDSSFRFFVIDPARDWLPGEGPCEILPVDARLPSARPPRVPAARDLDLNYSQAEKERTLMQVEQKMTAVSQGGFNYSRVNRYRNCPCLKSTGIGESCLFRWFIRC